MITKAIATIEKKIGKTKYGALLTLVGKLYSAFISYTTLVIIARLLSVNDFGVYTFFVSLISFLVVIGSAGSENTLLSLTSEKKNKSQKSFRNTIVSMFLIVIVVSSITIIILISSKNLVDNLVQISYYSDILIIMIWAVFFYALIKYFKALNQAEFQFNKAIIPENYIRPTLLFIFIVIIFLFDINNLINISISYVLSFFITSLVVLFWRRDVFLKKNIEYYSFDSSILKVSPYFMLIQLLNQLSNFIPVLIMGVFLTADSIGVFRASLQTTILVSFILASINMVFAPTISKLYSDSKLPQLKNFYIKTTKWTFAMGSWISVIVIMNAEFILNLFGPEYREWKWILIILTFGQLINSFTGSSGYLLLMTKNQKYMLYITFFQIITVITLSVLTVNYWGVYGIALSVTIGITVLNLLQLIFVYKKIYIHPYNINFIGLICSISFTLVIAFTIKFSYFSQQTLLNTVFLTTIITIIYFVLFFVFGLTKKEKRNGLYFIKNLLKLGVT
ncbi:hypothetical protein E3U55_14115 [Filobacillus milosensis]|uniref:Uncharacterized protein n=1 Tax=Filobacillus milosensis TaxID=94137 RepID=A0A4Y8IE36_9BACI|nr:oligosaccharide flippase family protein [Filobacillus milosensis]TFB14180.1 hypothetical protein E3U55_14115 [Filobacillus milosensis]